MNAARGATLWRDGDFAKFWPGEVRDRAELLPDAGRAAAQPAAAERRRPAWRPGRVPGNEVASYGAAARHGPVA